MGGYEVIESPSQPRHAVGEFVREGPLSRLQRVRSRPESAVEASPALGFRPYREGRRPTRTGAAQSSIPVIGDDGTAISRAGIRPAR
jgi:hypothetical protein